MSELILAGYCSKELTDAKDAINVNAGKIRVNVVLIAANNTRIKVIEMVNPCTKSTDAVFKELKERESRKDNLIL